MRSKSIFEELADEATAAATAAAQDSALKSQARSIIVLLNRKFGSVPNFVENKLYRIQDLAVLESYFIQAIDSQTLQEFIDSLPL